MRPRPLGGAVTLLTALAFGLLAGCAGTSGSAGETTSSPSASPTATGSASSAESTGPAGAKPTFAGEAISVTVSGDEVLPEMGRVTVDQGDRVRIVVTTDEPATVHVHGYDLEKEVKPGKPAMIDFTADTTGVFEVETHDGDLQLFELAVE